MPDFFQSSVQHVHSNIMMIRKSAPVDFKMGMPTSRVANDQELSQKMPEPFVNLITKLKNSNA